MKNLAETKNELKTKRFSRTDFYVETSVGDGKNSIFFTKVKSTLARIPQKRNSKLSSYNYRSLFNGQEFTVEAINKVQSVAVLFCLLSDSNLIESYTGTIFEMF